MSVPWLTCQSRQPNGCRINGQKIKEILNPNIAIPHDHGSWVFLFSPMLIGFFAGGKLNLSSFFLGIAAMSAFFMRQPVSIAVKAYSGRRSRADLPVAGFWIVIYGVITLGAATGLVLDGNWRVLLLTIPGVPVFAWHLLLVSRRAERRQAGVEILATGVLALVAPAAYWIGKGMFDPLGWALWLLTWLQSAASIVYVYLRLEQRDLASIPTSSELLRLGRRSIIYTSFNVLFSALGSLSGILPVLIATPFLLQWLETLWGTIHPAVGVRPIRIGLRQLLVSVLFTVLFILCWR